MQPHPENKALAKIICPVMDKDCDVAIKNKKYAFHHMKRTRSITDIIIFKRCLAKARRIILGTKQSSWQKFCRSITSNLELTTAWKIKRPAIVHSPVSPF